MRKTIKSGEEINSDIQNIINNFQNENDLIDKINTYVNSLTGKELLTENEIKNMIESELFNKVLDEGLTFPKNSLVYELYPFLKIKDVKQYKKRIKKFEKYHSNFHNNKYAILILTRLYHILDGEPELMYELLDSSDYFSLKYNDYPEFMKLKLFLFKNKDVSEMLYKHINIMFRELVLDLIIEKIIPLKAILIYFNLEKNVKQNTEHFYNLLRSKVSRQNIQSVIMENIVSIRNGKFERPLISEI